MLLNARDDVEGGILNNLLTFLFAQDMGLARIRRGLAERQGRVLE